MGQCLSSSSFATGGGTPDRYQARWTGPTGGLADGLGALEPHASKYASPAPVSNYATTADVGLGRGDQQYAFLHDKRPASPSKPAPAAGGVSPELAAAPRQTRPKHWSKGEMIGQGAFGSVYLGLDNDTGQLMAIKQVHIAKGMQSKKLLEHLASLEEEVHLLQQLEHPNIVRYLGTERTDDCLNIFLEYVPGGSIATLLAKFGGFKESVYTKQILLGLAYLHGSGIMHRDIKGANILVDKNGRVKLADFGASKKLEEMVTLETGGSKSVKGTPYWMAPEVIQQTGHGREADIWSVACTVIEMATGKPPWSNCGSQVAAMFHIASSKGPPTIPEHLSAECKDFLYLCFNRSWKSRPPATRLLEHPFLADVMAPAMPQPLTASMAAQQQQQADVKASSQSRRSTGVGPPPTPRPGAGDDGEPFNTPSPLNPKLAAAAQAQAGLASGAARISLATSEQQTPGGDSVAPSPLPRPSQQRGSSARWQFEAAPGAGAAAGFRPPSPSKRSVASLRASAPVFSGYAVVAMSQQAEPATAPRPVPSRGPSSSRLAVAPAAPPATHDLSRAGSGSSRGSAGAAEEVGSRGSEGCAGAEAEALEAEISSPESGPLPSEHDLYVLGGPPQLPPQQQQQQPNSSGPAGAAAQTPAPQLRAMQDLIQFASDSPEAAAAAAVAAAAQRGVTPSTGDSGASGRSAGFNPMEEPTWMQGGVSPLAGAASPVRGARTHEAAGGEGAAAGPTAAAEEQGRRDGAGPAAHAVQQASGAPAQLVVQEEHLVWTNDDGDIDALPWDVDGWGSGEQRVGGPAHEEQAAGAAVPADSPAEPVDQEQIMATLSRKAHLEVRASLALFEKSLNVPAPGGALRVHDNNTPSTSPGIAAVKPGAFAPRQEQQPAAGAAAAVAEEGAAALGPAAFVAGAALGMEHVWAAELSREIEEVCSPPSEDSLSSPSPTATMTQPTPLPMPQSKVVFALGLSSKTLIESSVQEARRRGVPPHKIVPWVRRKLGGGLLVVRFRTDGSPACAAPCILCSKEIERFDLKVVCVGEDGGWFCGRLSDPHAPQQRLTTGQKNAQFGKWEVARSWPQKRSRNAAAAAATAAATAAAAVP
eukprot:scaffold2.g6974.t1